MGSLLIVCVVCVVCVVCLAVGVVVVSLVAFALVGLSARQCTTIGGGPNDGAAILSGGAGAAIAALCLLAPAVVVGYGLWIIIS
jgi:hypothetical protein